MLPRHQGRATRPRSAVARRVWRNRHVQTYIGADADAMAWRYLAVLLITFQLSRESRQRKEPETANAITQTDDHAARDATDAAADQAAYTANGTSRRKDAKQ
jgi:hypothetical protein